MARGRMIDKCISTSEKFARLSSDQGRLLYLMILPHTDDYGYFEAEPFWIKHNVVPTLSGKPWELPGISEKLQELHEVGLIKQYVVASKNIGLITSFDEHQSGLNKRTRSKFPEIPGNSKKFQKIPPEVEQEVEENLIEKELTTFAPTDKNHRSAPENIVYNFETHQFDNILPSDTKLWTKAYPACDIELQLNKAAAWLEANPDKRKKNYKKFLSGWLSRAQERGGDVKSNVSNNLDYLLKKYEDKDNEQTTNNKNAE